MLRITKQTDYGLMLLAHIASLPSGKTVTARNAAEWSGLSLPMASKILKSLARGGVLESQRGVGGGFQLIESPERTSVADVIRALEGPISMVECGAHPGTCEQERICPTRVNWALINIEVEKALEKVSLSQLAHATALPPQTAGSKSNARSPRDPLEVVRPDREQSGDSSEAGGRN